LKVKHKGRFGCGPWEQFASWNIQFNIFICCMLQKVKEQRKDQQNPKAQFIIKFILQYN
jgi:hypothetical protein